MSTASRQGFNLFNKFGRHCFIMAIKRKSIPWHYVYTDTFGKFVCVIFGHGKTFDAGSNGIPIIYCSRCSKELT